MFYSKIEDSQREKRRGCKCKKHNVVTNVINIIFGKHNFYRKYKNVLEKKRSEYLEMNPSMYALLLNNHER